MKQIHLIATSCAALLAGTMFVAAQGMQKQAPGGDGGGQGQMQRDQAPDQKGKQGQREQGNKQQGQREQGKQQGTVGQGGGEQREQGRDQREQGRQGQQNQPKEKGKAGQAQREQGGKNQTTGQGQSKDKQGQSRDNQREGQQGQREQGQRNGQRDEQRGQAREGSSGNVTLTTEQRTRVRETVLSKGPRANNVNFSINIGTTVPRSVRVVAVDPILVEYYPRYRGHFYFIVNDQIVIVDSNHRIVAVIDV